MSILSKLVEKSGARRSIVDNVFYSWRVGKDFEESGEKVIVGEYSNTPWFVEGVLEAGFAKSGVGSRDGHGNGGTRMLHILPR